MGTIQFAAKIAHVPSVYLGAKGVFKPLEGIHEPLREGLDIVRRRMDEEGVDVIFLMDCHWINTVDFHINAAARHRGKVASDEQPHRFHDYAYDYRGDREIATLIAKEATDAGITTHAHDFESLDLSYGALVPLHFMNADAKYPVVPMGMNVNATHDQNMKFGEVLARAIGKSGRKVALLASGSLSHEMHANEDMADRRFDIVSEFNRQVDLRVIELIESGQIAAFIDMLPKYREVCHGECRMADTSILMGALGGKGYRGKGKVLGEYCTSGGTGQAVIEFERPAVA